MSAEIITDDSTLLTPQQADEIWELGNAGAQNAATALSSLLSTQVDIHLQNIIMVNLAHLQQYLDDSVAAMVLFHIRGQVSGDGSIILHVPHASIIKLSSIMLGTPDEDREIDEMDKSMLHEVGNIMTSTFLDAFASLLSIILLPSPPSMVVDMPHAVIESVIAAQELDNEMDHVLLFKTDMICAQHEIDAGILLIPSKPLLKELLERFRKVRASRSS
ncbi:MAG TPA: chemotaxis protein CheC [Methanospirillum sp.]|nr:chemotaxis protein CheC [Methanospirillum sp.]